MAHTGRTIAGQEAQTSGSKECKLAYQPKYRDSAEILNLLSEDSVRAKAMPVHLRQAIT